MNGAACRQKSVFDAKSTSCGRGPSSELTPTASVIAMPEKRKNITAVGAMMFFLGLGGEQRVLVHKVI